MSWLVTTLQLNCVCSVYKLFNFLGMLMFVVLSIMAFRWRMNKSLGFIMFLLYFLFLLVSLLFEYDVLECPQLGSNKLVTTEIPFLFRE